MKRLNIILGALFGVCLMASTCFAGLSQFAGNWKNVDSNTRGITTLEIAVSGTTVRVHAWGSCTPQDCDWGTVQAIAYAPNVSSSLAATANAMTAVFITNFNQTTLVITPLPGNVLQVQSFTHFTADNRTDYFNVYTFKQAPAPAAAVTEDCIPFSPANAQVVKISNSWKIVDGNHWIFDFGNNRGEADKALSIIKRYGMTRSCFVGRPDPSFQYMSINGIAPAGAMPGEDCISFNPATIEVKNIGGRWKIVDGGHFMFDFAGQESEARLAFAIIRNYGFNKSCFVGRPDPSFTYLRK